MYELPEDVKTLLEKEPNNTFLSGSYAWGCATENSDYDIVCIEHVKASLETYLESVGYQEQEASGIGYIQPYYVKDGIKINIISLSPCAYPAWYCATMMMHNAAKNVLLNRQCRRLLFTLIVDCYIHLVDKIVDLT